MISKHLKYEDYSSVPWKNGLGVTLELASAQLPKPEGSEAFLWRISIAEMTTSNKFSLFLDTNRVLTVISGEGLVLKDMEAGKNRSCLPLSPVSFSGAELLYGELMNGPVQNFNVMVNSDCADAVVQLVENSANLELSGDVNYFYVLSTSAEVYFSSQADDVLVRAGESYLTEVSGTISIERLQAEAELPLKIMHVCITLQ